MSNYTPAKPTSTQAVLYARVSSKDQALGGFSVPAQIKFLEEYAEGESLCIIKSFTDTETAKKAGRVQFNHMFAFIKENPTIKHILVEKTDRLLRNIKDYALVDDLIENFGLNIHLVKENVLLSRESRSHDKTIFGFKVVMAKGFSDNLSEEVTKGMQEKALQGSYPSGAPYGYLNAMIDGKKVIVVDPDSAPFIIKMFELYATGSYSLLNLRKKMLADGMIYKNGKNFYKSSLTTILKNVFYTGAFMWKGQKYDKGSHEAIVNKELFEKVQTLMRNPFKNKSRKGLFPYANLIKCGICGCALTAEFKKERYIYYRCSGYKGNCRQVYLKQEMLEKQFEDILANITISEETQRLIMESLRSSLQDKIEYHNTLVTQTHRQIKFLQNRIDQAYLDKIDRKISEEYWQAHAPKWMEEKERLTMKLVSMQRADKNYLENVNLILELTNKAVALFQKQDSDQKRRLVDILVSNCSYKDEKLDVELKPIFQQILKTAETRDWCARLDLNQRPTD